MPGSENDTLAPRLEVQHTQLSVLKNILNLDDVDVDSEDGDGHTPLQ